MNPLDWILISVLAATVIAAAISVIRRRKSGKHCSCGCESCPYPCKK